MNRAEVRAEPEDVGDQALMRGLDTAFPFVRPGLSLSGVGSRRGAGTASPGIAPGPPPPPPPCTGRTFRPFPMASASGLQAGAGLRGRGPN
jgi:hypothetical protein